jgi:hypothetical protein
MSAETRQALEDAMTAHFNDEAEQTNIITGYVIAAAQTNWGDDHARHSYWFDAQVNQPPHVTLGLIAMAGEWSDTGVTGWDDDDD